MKKSLLTIIAALTLMSCNIPEKYQEIFDNVYLQKTFTRPYLSTSSIYNFKDNDSLSYYIGCAHFSPKLDYDSLKVINFKGNSSALRFHNVVDSLDVCITKSVKDNIKAVKLKTVLAKDLIIGEDCYIIGYPKGMFRSVKKSNISGVIGEEYKVIITDNICVQGYSGAPVFVKRGKDLCLVGIVNSYMEMTKNTFVIPVDYFIDRIK